MKYKYWFFCLYISLFLTGCWDNVEIQERGYVTGITIDKPHPIPRGQEPKKDYLNERDLERMPLQEESEEYAYTIELPLFSKAKMQPTGAGGGTTDGDPSWAVTLLGNSFMEVNREFATRLNLPPFYEHLQSIVISEDVARDGLDRVLDMFLRDHEMRRRTRIFITPGEAKKLLDVFPRIEDYPSFYLSALPKNADKTSRMLHITDLGKVSESIHKKGDFVLPRVIATKDEIKDAGAAVFKNGKMVGWLGEIDTIYLKWVADTVEGGVIVIEDPHKHKGIIALEIIKAKTNVKPVIEGKQIKMNIDVDATFSLAEKFEVHYESAYYEPYLKELEKTAEEKIANEIENTIKHVQKEYGADIFYFGANMRRYEPDAWREIKDDWNDVFKQVETDITVKVTIRQIGTMK